MQGDICFIIPGISHHPSLSCCLMSIDYMKMIAVFVLNIKIKLLTMKKIFMFATMNNYNTLLDWKKIKGTHSKHQATFESFSSL